MKLETERLYLRHWEPSDFADLADMLQDPRVMYAYEHRFLDADVQEWLERQIARYQKDGFGLCAMVEKQSGMVVGQAGLSWQPCQGEKLLEIGYHLKWKYWGRGYATEAALGCRRYAFEILGAPAVYSIIKSDNTASMRVAERTGMRRLGEFMATYYAGAMRHYLYGVQNPQKADEPLFSP